MNWDCARCSFSNHPDLPICEMCEFQKPAAQGYIVSLPTKQTTQSSSNPKQTVPNYTAHNSDGTIKSGCVEGLTELILQQGVGNDKLSYTVCVPPCAHYSQRGSYGAAWSCGYRNIQMLCSSLMRVPAYQAVMFNRDGRIPDIAQLQGWIERAWAAGFDVQVRAPVLCCIYFSFPLILTSGDDTGRAANSWAAACGAARFGSAPQVHTSRHFMSLITVNYDKLLWVWCFGR
jgi:hypothetical protein